MENLTALPVIGGEQHFIQNDKMHKFISYKS